MPAPDSSSGVAAAAGTAAGLDCPGLSLAARVVGVDEVGRGPLAGPVVAAAVMLDPRRPVAGLRDSKKLSPRRRAALAEQLQRDALCVSFGRAEVEEIDRLNILAASLLAMERAVAGLRVDPELVLVDGQRLPSLPWPARAVIGGDDTVAAISAASIVAKEARDAEMCRLAQALPGYGFERHKGYGTAEHLAALAALGPSPEHRHSFAPVRRAAQARSAATVPCP